MPRVELTYWKDKECVQVKASGWFLLWLSFTNDPRAKIKEFIKKYK